LFAREGVDRYRQREREETGRNVSRQGMRWPTTTSIPIWEPATTKGKRRIQDQRGLLKKREGQDSGKIIIALC